jgi:hypothetical protein
MEQKNIITYLKDHFFFLLLPDETKDEIAQQVIQDSSF